MTVRDDRGDVKQTTTGFRGPLMVQSLTSAKSKFLSLSINDARIRFIVYDQKNTIRFICNNSHACSKPLHLSKGDNNITLKVPDFPLLSGNYYFNLTIKEGQIILDDVEYAGKFIVEDGDFFATGKIPGVKDGVLVSQEWFDNDKSLLNS